MNDDKKMSMRIIKHQHEYEPDEKVIELSMEMSFNELLILKSMIDVNLSSMSHKDYYYHDVCNIQRHVTKAIKQMSGAR